MPTLLPNSHIPPTECIRLHCAILQLTMMMIVHIRLFDFLVTNFGTVGLSPVKVFRNNEYYRVITSPFYHINDYHLIYCMVSFAMKARYLEPYLGKVTRRSRVVYVLSTTVQFICEIIM